MATSSSKRHKRVNPIIKKKTVASAAAVKGKHLAAKAAGKKILPVKKPAPASRKPSAPIVKTAVKKGALAKTAKPTKVPAKASASKAGPAKPVLGKSLASKVIPAKNVKTAATLAESKKISTASHGESHATAPMTPVPTPPAGKSKKNPAGLSSKDIQFFTEQLLAKRRELVGDMSSMEREALRSGSGSNLSTLPMHMADMGTDNFEQEFTLGLVEKDRTLLREINHALSKILNGTYGICEGTGLPISKFRLEAAPWARFGIEYARQREKNGMGVRTL